jgi:hypothetical protein
MTPPTHDDTAGPLGRVRAAHQRRAAAELDQANANLELRAAIRAARDAGEPIDAIGQAAGGLTRQRVHRHLRRSGEATR